MFTRLGLNQAFFATTFALACCGRTTSLPSTGEGSPAVGAPTSPGVQGGAAASGAEPSAGAGQSLGGGDNQGGERTGEITAGSGGESSSEDSSSAGAGGESQSCSTGHFNDANAALTCRPWTDCKPGEFVLIAGTASSDRVCAPCEVDTFSAQTNAATCTTIKTRVGLLRKYDSSGAPQWSRELVSPYADGFNAWFSVDVDRNGYVYVTGFTDGGLLQLPRPLNSDAMIRKYDAGGAELWTKELVASRNQYGVSIKVANDGNMFVTGYTGGAALPGQIDAGATDGFLVLYEPER